MKVLHLYSSGKSAINGVTNAVVRLSDNQRSLGHDVLSLDIRKKPSVKSILGFRPDIVSFNGLYQIDFVKIALALLINSIPYLVVFHGGASKNNYRKHSTKKRIANLLCFNRFVRSANAVVYLNQGEYNNSIFRAINPRFIILPNGVDVCPAVSNTRHEKVNIMFFSRIDVYGKGLDVLAEVIKRVAYSEMANAILFTFYGHMYESSKEYFNQFDPKLVEYRGTVYGEEKRRAFEDADIVILPSRSEGMPLTVLEAFSFGRPVIVTPETNMAEVVKANNVGWVSGLSVDELYNTVVKAVKEYNDDFDGYHMRSYRCSLEYSWEAVAKKSVEEYCRVIVK